MPTEQTAAIITTYNAHNHLAYLLYSLCRVCRPKPHIYCVDNGSNDQTIEILNTCQRNGLLTWWPNPYPPYHGTAINYAIERLQANYRYVWVLDQDCVVLRPHIITHSIFHLGNHHAAILGDAYRKRALHPSCLFIDLHRAGYGPYSLQFDTSGNPFRECDRRLRDKGLLLLKFHYRRRHYVLHYGSRSRHLTTNPDSPWSQRWATECWFRNDTKAKIAYAELLNRFVQDINEYTPPNIARACKKRGRVRIRSLGLPRRIS